MENNSAKSLMTQCVATAQIVEGYSQTKSRRHTLLITAIHAKDFPTNDKRRKVFIKVQAGNVIRQTDVLKDCSASPSWNMKIHLNALEASTVILFSVYRYHTVLRNELLCSCRVPLQDFPSDKKEITLALGFGTSFLIIHYERDINSAIGVVLPESALVMGLGKTTPPDNKSTIQNLGAHIQANAFTLVPILQSIDEFKPMFDQLARIHPFATAAWALLGLAYVALKDQNDKDQSILMLYRIMMQTYAAASKDDILKQYDEFKVVFDVMLGQTMECAVFISEYTSKPYLSRFFTAHVHVKVQRFCELFANLEKQFHDRMVRETTVVSLGTYSSVQFIEMKAALAVLHILPSAPHRDCCLTGTRVEIIEEIWSWIGKCEPGVLWVHGLAGSGKSALASTIVDHARSMPGDRGRLGAFIRFDRSGVNDQSRVMTTLASKLAAFDDRIGRAITDVVKKCPDINEWPLSAQFTKLVVKTLQSAEELRSEGPIVVVVDALDECGVPGKRADLLDIFSQGFGENLPMMRLVIMSRPEEDIQKSFNSERKRHIVTLPLAVRSQSGNDDIRRYFDEKSREIQNTEFQRVWRQRDAATKLTKRANGHFIWAATAYEYIREYPVRRLEEVLAARESIGLSAEGDLDTLYNIALRSAVGARGGDIKADMIPLLGAVIVAKTPLLLTTLNSLAFGSGGAKSSIILEKLGSVASFGEGEPVRLLHKSFDDFLIDPRRSGEWHVCTDNAHTKMAFRCLVLLSEFFDGMQPGMAPTEANRIPDEILYASIHWLEHVISIPRTKKDIDIQLRRFLRKHFLKWLEITAVLGKILEAVVLLQRLLGWTNEVQCDENDRKMRYGAYQFASRFTKDIQEDRSLIYTTALTFAPQNSIIRQIYCTGKMHKVVGTGTDRLLILCPHDDYVYSVRFSPDGSKIVSGTDSGAIQLWDATTGMSLCKVQHRGDSVPSVAFSPDGSKLVSGSADKTVRIWSTATGDLLDIFEGHEDPVRFVAFSPDGSRIVSASFDNTIRLWDATSGESLFPPLEHDGIIYSVAFSPDGSRIVSGSQDKTIRLWDAVTGTLLQRINGHDDEINTVVFSPDGSKIVSGSFDATIQLWDATTGAPLLERLRCHSSSVYCVIFSPNGSEIVSGSGDSTVRVSHSTTGASLMEPFNHSNTVGTVAISPDGIRIASGSLDGALRVRDATVSVPEPLQGHTGVVNCAAFSLDGATVVSGASDKTIHMWHTNTGLSQFGPICLDHEITAVAFSPDGSKIAAGSADSALRVCCTTTTRLLHGALRGHTKAIRSVRFSNDGTKIISGSDDKTIRLWDTALGKSVCYPFIGHDDSVISVAESPDGSKLASGSADDTVRIWDANTGISIIGPLQGHRRSITAVTFSPDGSQIVSGSDDATIRVWDIVTGTSLMELRGHDDSITSLAFAFPPESRKLISTSNDRTVRSWHILPPLNREHSLAQTDSKVITKFPRGVIPKSTCIAEQTVYVAGIPSYSRFEPRRSGLMIIDISSLIA